MNTESFGKSTSGRIVRGGPANAPYHAFVPHPLPPRVEFSPNLVLLLSDADRALGELSGYARNLANPELIVRPFIRREAVLSSRIEGTFAGILDVYTYETTRHDNTGDAREVYNYAAALEYGLERLATLPVSLRLIRELHDRLLDGVRGNYAMPGSFRTTQNWIGGRVLEDAVFVPPPPSDLAGLLDAFEKYLHEPGGLPPLIKLALIHYQFEAIHPFVDGNGRVGRLLISLLLVHWGLLPSPLLYLSAYLEAHRERYCELLQFVSEKGDWTAWIEFFLTGVAQQAQDATGRVRQIEDLQASWRDRLAQAGRSALLLKIPDLLVRSPYVTIPEVQAHLKVSYPAAKNLVNQLEKEKILARAPSSSTTKVYEAIELTALVTPPGDSF
jgi:Fic family protein